MASEHEKHRRTYTWTQTNDQLHISFLVDTAYRPFNPKTQLKLISTPTTLAVNLENEHHILQGKLFASVVHFDTLWQTEKHSSKQNHSVLTIHLEKENSGVVWPYLFQEGTRGWGGEEARDRAALAIESEDYDLTRLSQFWRESDMDPTSEYLLAKAREYTDPTGAFAHLKRAAGAGYRPAIMEVARCYRLGQEDTASDVASPVEKEAGKAFTWYRYAAFLDDAEACHVVASDYVARVVAKRKSVRFETKPKDAVETSTAAANACAKNKMEEKNETDDGLVDMDADAHAKALEYYQRAMILGGTKTEFFSDAAYRAGLLTLDGGYGLPGGDVTTTRQLWKQSAREGHADSCWSLGVLALTISEEGTTVPPPPPSSSSSSLFSSFSSSSTSDVRRAGFDLDAITPEQLVEAKAWFGQALTYRPTLKMPVGFEPLLKDLWREKGSPRTPRNRKLKSAMRKSRRSKVAATDASNDWQWIALGGVVATACVFGAWCSLRQRK